MNITPKIQAMREGGKILAHVREKLVSEVKTGVTAEYLEDVAQKEIAKHAGAKAAFALVPGYHWATCIMRNDEVCHGIPRNKVIQEGDVVSIDVGVFYKGFYTDTTTTVCVGTPSKEIQRFLEIGKQALNASIKQARAGKSVWHMSSAMQKVIERAGYSCVYQLTGHGVGKQLHEEPSIPCIADDQDKKILLKPGMTIAIEPMYTMGNAQLRCGDDGWTYSTVDGSLSGMFEHTVLITDGEPEILTK